MILSLCVLLRLSFSCGNSSSPPTRLFSFPCAAPLSLFMAVLGASGSFETGVNAVRSMSSSWFISCDVVCEYVCAGTSGGSGCLCQPLASMHLCAAECRCEPHFFFGTFTRHMLQRRPVSSLGFCFFIGTDLPSSNALRFVGPFFCCHRVESSFSSCDMILPQHAQCDVASLSDGVHPISSRVSRNSRICALEGGGGIESRGGSHPPSGSPLHVRAASRSAGFTSHTLIFLPGYRSSCELSTLPSISVCL